MTQVHKNKSLDLLFKPRNVAIFEAKEKLGYFVGGFRSQKFNEKDLYLISPTEEELFGIKCYKSIDDVPSNTIDLLIMAVRREFLMKSLKEIFSKRNVNFVHLFTAGTGEFDEFGSKVERELKEFFDKHPETRALGPNCMGVYCPLGRNAYLPMFPTEIGNISLIFHSGDLNTRTVMFGNSRYRLAFSKCASIGNCINLQVSDFLEYLNNDEETDIIGIYFEGFSKYHKEEGKKLLQILKRTRKPVLFLRGGMTNRGQTAVLTHTGSLGTKEKIWQAIYEQTPLIEVGSSLDEMVDYMFMFHKFFKKHSELPFNEQLTRYPKSKNTLVILWSGGLGIIDTDKLTQLGLNLPLFDEKTKNKLNEVYPIKIGSLNNPLDLPWVSRSEKYLELCKAAVTEDIDLVIMHTNAWGGRDKERFERYYQNLKEIRDHIESLNKTLIIVLADNPYKYRNDYYQILLNDGFMVYPSLERGAKSFLKLYEYGRKMNRIHFEKDLV